MASIFDAYDPIISLKPESGPEPGKRSKHRETLTAAEIAKGKTKLADMVDMAFDTLKLAAKEADYGVAIKAAQIILDRAGFGPKSALDVTTTNIDLSNLTREQLAERAVQIAGVLRAHAEEQKISKTVN
jgi:hypothetical protein